MSRYWMNHWSTVVEYIGQSLGRRRDQIVTTGTDQKMLKGQDLKKAYLIH